MARPRKPLTETVPSIYKGADGLWHARIVMGVKPDGSTDRKHVRRKDKTDLLKTLRGLERDRDIGAYAWTEDDPTLAVWVEHWLRAILPMTVRRKTLDTYRSQMHKHLLPTLGHHQLSSLRPEHFESLYVSLGQHGRSAYTIRAVHRVTRSALNEAVRRRRLMHNPILIARQPRLVETEVDPLSVTECQRVLAVTATMHNGPRWSLALALGMRQGEVLGLLWGDVDLDAGVLRVRRSSQRWIYRHGCVEEGLAPTCGRARGGSCPDRRDGGLRLVEPKTSASKRTIVVPHHIIAELRTHRARQAEARLATGPAWIGTHDLVFANAHGEIIDPGKDLEQWNRILKKAGVRKVRVHDARHTAATLMLLQETDIRTVMAVMGWTEMATAQRYTHAVDDLRRRAATKMGDMLWPTGSASA